MFLRLFQETERIIFFIFFGGKKGREDCSTQFTREKDFKYHQKGCHECICEECNESFDHEQKLKRHKDKKHKDSNKCDHCQKTFAEKRNLIRHQKSHA